jgi:hypothetical protein
MHRESLAQRFGRACSCETRNAPQPPWLLRPGESPPSGAVRRAGGPASGTPALCGAFSLWPCRASVRSDKPACAPPWALMPPASGPLGPAATSLEAGCGAGSVPAGTGRCLPLLRKAGDDLIEAPSLPMEAAKPGGFAAVDRQELAPLPMARVPDDRSAANSISLHQEEMGPVAPIARQLAVSQASRAGARFCSRGANLEPPRAHAAAPPATTTGPWCPDRGSVIVQRTARGRPNSSSPEPQGRRSLEGRFPDLLLRAAIASGAAAAAVPALATRAPPGSVPAPRWRRRRSCRLGSASWRMNCRPCGLRCGSGRAAAAVALDQAPARPSLSRARAARRPRARASMPRARSR